jgi:hypothetical protein
MATQHCYVCGRPATLVTERILVQTGGSLHRLVGECPKCRRFICVEHAELLDLGGKRSWFRRKPSLLTACCPFDPDTPLGG